MNQRFNRLPVDAAVKGKDLSQATSEILQEALTLFDKEGREKVESN
jgi:hypothetical protein